MRLIQLPCALVLIGAPILAASAAGAQDIPAAAVYNSSARMPTNFSGIMRFADPPEGFNPVTATPEQRAQYGFPPPLTRPPIQPVMRCGKKR